MKTQTSANCSNCTPRLANIFCQLEGVGLNQLTQSRMVHTYKKKQIIYYQGNSSLGVYCIQSGRVKIYRTSSEGKQYIIRLAEAGDVLGLPTLFSNTPFLWTAEMIEEGNICFIPKQIVLEIIRKDPPTAQKVMETLSMQLEESEKERVELAQGAVRERMARLLSLLSQSHGVKVKNGTLIDLKLSREEMAEMIGTAAETTMRLLKDFKEEKVLQLHGKEIIILDEARLAKTANLLD
jgi:CRP/FNR family transcriptional regulator, polysaccharide utilization system transcription regulator